jgi:hypothetical protein
MNKAAVVEGVSRQIVWWMGERQKKLAELRHETLSVNPFLLPLIFGIHQFKDFDELAEFLVAAHLSTGYATGFGKLLPPASKIGHTEFVSNPHFTWPGNVSDLFSIGVRWE